MRRKLVVPKRSLLADLQIMTRILHEIATAMLSNDPAQLFRQLQEMEVYCSKFKKDLWHD